MDGLDALLFRCAVAGMVKWFDENFSGYFIYEKLRVLRKSSSAWCDETATA
ncbi:hypothetical protein ACLOJK_036262 [Asimina triloba]